MSFQPEVIFIISLPQFFSEFVFSQVRESSQQLSGKLDKDVWIRYFPIKSMQETSSGWNS